MAGIGVLSLPNLGATKGGTQEGDHDAFTLAMNNVPRATYGDAVTVGTEVDVNVVERRETVALTAHAEMLVQYKDWVSIPEHEHVQLRSEPD